ncbi:MAG: hypothetical protein ACT4PE_02640 [Candidatus Eiseniibacteriota bacterium]
MRATPRLIAASVATFALVSLTACSKAPQESAPGGGDQAALPVPGTGEQPTLPVSLDAPLPTTPGGLQQEFMSLQQRLGGIQQQAMQDTTLQREYAALDAVIEQGMTASEPQLAQHRSRLDAIRDEMSAAQQAGDEAKFQALLQEGTTLQGRLQKVQQDTMQRADVQEKMGALRDRMIAKMAVIDPQTPALVQRADAIGAQLAAGSGPPPGQ